MFMNKYEKSIMFRPMLMKVLFVIIAVLNVGITLNTEKGWTFNLFQFVIVGVWFYATLCALGHFCIPANVIQGDMELYEARTPIMPLGFIRIVECGFHWVVNPKTFNWKLFLIVIGVDLFFLFFLLLDKSSYGYAKSIDDPDNRYHS